MQIRLSLRVVLFVLFFSPTIAGASDYSGLGTMYYYTFIGLPYAVISAVVTCILLALKKYKSKRLLVSHMAITLFVCFVGLMIMVEEGMIGGANSGAGILVLSLLYGIIFIGLAALQYFYYNVKWPDA
jgi:hypothetical protein